MFRELNHSYVCQKTRLLCKKDVKNDAVLTFGIAIDIVLVFII